MKVDKLSRFTKGWFVGNFEPSLIKTQDVEVSVKVYSKGESEERHFHKIATELTVIISGRVAMNGVEYFAGDIVVIEPGEATDFLVLEDTVTTVVKFPGAKDDKYIGEIK